MIAIPGANHCTITVQIVTVTDKGNIIDLSNELPAKSRAICIEIRLDFSTALKDQMSNIPIRSLSDITDIRLLDMNSSFNRELLKIGQEW